MIINEPIMSKGARTIGTHSFVEPLHIVIRMRVVLELDMVLAFKTIAGKNKFMQWIVTFKGLYTTYVKILFYWCLHLLQCILMACLDLLLTRSPSINTSCWLHPIGCVHREQATRLHTLLAFHHCEDMADLECLACLRCIKRAPFSPDKGNYLMSGSVAALRPPKLNGGLMFNSKWHPRCLF